MPPGRPSGSDAGTVRKKRSIVCSALIESTRCLLSTCVRLAQACQLTAADAARFCGGLRYLLGIGADMLGLTAQAVRDDGPQALGVLPSLLSGGVQTVLAMLLLAAPFPGIPAACAPPLCLGLWMGQVTTTLKDFERLCGGPGMRRW